MNTVFYISETFNSIQGEGNCAGALSYFIRFQHCNLTCSWCDSKFSWGENKGVKSLSADEIKTLIKKSTAPNVILTGGEPCLYQLDTLVVENKKFHIETNGTIIPTEALDIELPDGNRMQRAAMDEKIISQFNWVVSPKMGNAKQTIDENAMRYWASKNWCIFKFIIQNEKDILEVETIVNKYQLDKKRVYLGLEGISSESQIKPDLVDAIVAKGYNFSPRLHVLLWGAKRMK